jgi:hypothetical protein
MQNGECRMHFAHDAFCIVHCAFQGASTVPAPVQGPHRAMRFIAFHPPRTSPSRAITVSA